MVLEVADAELAVKSDTRTTLPLVEVDAMPKLVSMAYIRIEFTTSLPDVVMLKLPMDEAEPVCRE